MQNQQRVLVTGGSGFVGTYVVYELLKAGFSVAATRREQSDMGVPQKVFQHLNELSGSAVDFDSIEWVYCDLLDPNAVAMAVAERGYVVHTAASVSFQPKERDSILRNNIDCTANVVNACLEVGVQQLLHISSVGGLPNPDKKDTLDESFLDSTFYQFETTYGESKYRSEMEVWRGLGEGLNVTVFNPGIVLGAWRFVNSSTQMFRSIYNKLPFFSGGLTGFVDARDIAQSVVKSIGNESTFGQRYILVSDNLSYKDFLWQVADALGVKRPSIKAGQTLSTLVALCAETWAGITGSKAFITREIAQSANRRTHFVNDKAQSALKIAFEPLEETIQWTTQFFLNNPDLR